MATSYYTQPAAANYHTPPAHSLRQRGYRMCDQCGAAENPSVSRFRLCGGCVRLSRSRNTIAPANMTLSSLIR